MFNPFSLNRIQEVTRNSDGSFFYQLFSSSNNSSNSLLTDREKLRLVLQNPAALRVFKLNCDLFSLGNFKAYKNGDEIEDNELVKRLSHPNKFQTKRQFLWDYMFWNMLGTAYLNTSSKVLKDSTQLYFLNPACFEWTDKLCKKLDRLALSNKSFNDLQGLTIRYQNLDGTYTPYKLSDIMPFFDLSNGLGNWYKGSSSIDALYGIIKNSERSIKTKDTTLEFSAKYLVSGKQNKGVDVSSLPMGNTEKQSIENTMHSNKPVHAVKHMLDIKRFVDDIDKLKLDDSYADDLFKIGSMYNIPKNILNALLKDTSYQYERHDQHRLVEQVLQPKGNDLCNGLERLFGYDESGIEIVLDFSHLSFMQVIEDDKANIVTKKLANLQTAKELGGLTDEEVKDRIKLMML